MHFDTQEIRVAMLRGECQQVIPIAKPDFDPAFSIAVKKINQVKLFGDNCPGRFDDNYLGRLT